MTKPATALVLRCCDAEGKSHDGTFQWPLTVGAEAAAPDWHPRAECGNGLHGWLYGQGDHSAASIVENAVWLVVEVEEASLVMLGGKCKYPRGVVRFVGKRHEAAAYIIEHEPRAKTCAVIGAVLSVGDGEACVVGALGTATAGDRGTATAGDRGTATAGDRGTATAGYRGTATAGDSGTATAGYRGTGHRPVMKPLRSTAPTTSILNPAFAYTDAASTDIGARFRRVQREQADIARARAEQEAREAARTNVRTINRRSKT